MKQHLRKVSILTVFTGILASRAAIAVNDGTNPIALKNWKVPSVETMLRTYGDSPSTRFVNPGDFQSTVPCRLVDTRSPNGTFGGPKFAAGETRTYSISSGGLCGFSFPANIAAASLNITVTETAGTGFVTGYATGGSLPGVSNVTFASPNQTISNAAIIPTAGGSSSNINIFSSQATHIIIDINGIWQTSPAGLVRTVVVSPVPGNALASGSALLNALAGITDASSTNSYLLKLEPGVFDLGNSTLTTKLGVDIEGSGRSATTITTGAALTINDSMTSIEIRSLSIQNKAVAPDPVAILANGGAVKLRDVSVIVDGGSASSTGISASAPNSGVVLRAVEVSASGTGAVVGVGSRISDLQDVTVSVSGGTSNRAVFITGTLSMRNSVVTASGSASEGVFINSFGPAQITSSTISGASSSIHNGNCAAFCPEARVATSQLIGPLVGPGTILCRASWDQNWDSVCP
jgi:hypothetical protein